MSERGRSATFGYFLKALNLGRGGLYLALIILPIVALIFSPQAPTVLEEPQTQAIQSCTQTRQSESDGEPEFGFTEDVYQWRCEPEQSAEYRQNDAKEKPRTSADADLLAQERVAHWTLWIGIYTAIGLMAIVATFEVTREQAIATRQIGVVQSRAYVDIANASVQVFQAGQPFIGDIEIHNTGQTPANQLQVSHTTYVTEFPIPIPIVPLGEMGGYSSATLGANRTFVIRPSSSPTILDQALIDRIRNETAAVSVAIKVRYVDVFGEAHEAFAKVTVYGNDAKAGGIMFTTPNPNG